MVNEVRSRSGQGLTGPGPLGLAGGIGVGLLAAMLWGVIEFAHRPMLVEAQEPVATETKAVSPWQAASFPVENFVAYTSPFGYRQHPFGGVRFHYGLDIAAPLGSYVRAWWSGRVVQVSDDTACGTGVVIQSGEWLPSTAIFKDGWWSSPMAIVGW